MKRTMNITLQSLDFYYISCSSKYGIAISKHIVGPYFQMLFATLRVFLQICFSHPLCHEPIGYVEIMLCWNRFTVDK